MVWTDEALNAAIDERVAAMLVDEEGKTRIEGILTGLADTEFAEGSIKRILSDPEEIEDWRVGEAIAEAYLVDHRACQFPWPDSRDDRKRGSSLPGADLVGFGADAKGFCLAFGEVKTSSEAKYPPGLMYGRTGFKKQLEDLRDSQTIRNDLFIYLWHRPVEASWKSQFEAASIRYLKNPSDVLLFGVLVRDVPPNRDDLRVRVQDLANSCPDETKIELLAIYLPNGCIEGIGKVTLKRRKRA